TSWSACAAGKRPWRISTPVSATPWPRSWPTCPTGAALAWSTTPPARRCGKPPAESCHPPGRALAIVTVSHQHGSRGDGIAAELAQRLGFSLVTPEKVDEVIRQRYRLDLSLSGDIDQLPRENHASKVFANLISAILTDMALLQDLVVLECGGQFIF